MSTEVTTARNISGTPEQRGLSADFNRLWAAQSVSLVGTSLTALALPLLAVRELDASSFQMGLLAAAETLPFLLFSLFAGVWVDRRPRRPILVATDLLRAGLLLTVPVATLLDLITLVQLYLVAFLVGSLWVLFEIAHYAYVPALVGKSDVVRANSRLQMSYSVADSGGPGLAGMLVQLVGTPVALLLDAASYVVSALFLRRIERPEPDVAPREPVDIRGDIASGLRFVLSHRYLRPIILGSIVDGFTFGGIAALFVLFASRELDLRPFAIGLVFAARGIGSIPGAMLSSPIAQRIGIGPAILSGWVISALLLLAIPLASGPSALLILVTTAFAGHLAATVLNVQQWSLRQVVTPDQLQGRVTASHRFLVVGAQPLGALAGGGIGALLGLRPALAVMAVLALLAPALVALSPIRSLTSRSMDAAR